MHWDDLKHVLAIGRASTLSGAGTLLGVTHTTVSRRLATVEAQLGVRLFDRTPDGLVPTPAGQEILELADRVEGDVLSVEGRVMGLDAHLKGPLRVSMVDFLFAGLRDAFATFIQRYPNVELTLNASDDLVSLQRRDADVVLRLTEQPPEHLIGRKLAMVPFAPYVHRDLAESVPEGALGDLPWIGWDERVDSRWYRSWLAAHAPGARVVIRVDMNAILRRQAVLAGMGAFFMPCFEADAEPSLVRLPAEPMERPLWLLTLPDLRHTGRVRALLDHLVETMPRQPVSAH